MTTSDHVDGVPEPAAPAAEPADAYGVAWMREQIKEQFYNATTAGERARRDKWLDDFLLTHRAAHAGPKPAAPAAERPDVVCLCGSTRFKAEYEAANERLTLSGAIVLAPGCFSRSTPDEAARGIFKGCKPEQKVALDALHLRKIDMADRVVVICPGGYIGESTAREIEYAMRTGKPVEFIEDYVEVAAEPADAAREAFTQAALTYFGCLTAANCAAAEAKGPDHAD